MMIDEAVNEAMMDEGFFGNVGRGLKSAFGGDAQRMGKAASRMGKSAVSAVTNAGKAVGQAATNAGKAIGQAATSAKNAVGQAATNMATGIQNKANDIRIGYQSGKQNDQLNKIKSTLQTMLTNGTLGKGRVAKSAQNFIATLDQAIRNNNNAAKDPRGIQANRFSEE
jgi:hypothetical protein